MEAPRPKQQEVRREPALAAAAAAGGGGLGAMRQLIDVDDRRLQGAVFLLFWGCSIITYGTVLNRSANPEHVLAGFFIFTAGVGLVVLTLAGAGTGRAASRVEEALRGFF
ncbi:hypothetical protein PR202_ga14641 [Eleusine coracana subsp. coracana]|uniref:Uncharacterized protein n=1 Tax=Eleusine coracana subsp. coracana TaxID=191504 RepID=A0AAV5CHR2_ELECO|nr:hypothetical protein PR202_ga14641 [Eleusine coracana subsp. coracana]